MPDDSFHHLLPVGGYAIFVVAVVLDRGLAPVDPGRSAKASWLFGRSHIAPAATHAFEIELQRLLREIGRVIVQWVFNRLDPEQSDQAPLWFNFEGNLYRRRERSPRRWGVGMLFGIITLERIRYEPADAGIGLLSVFPLEMRLGIVVGKATLGLAERVGKWTAQYARDCAATVARGASDRVVGYHASQVAAHLSLALAPLTLPATS